MNNPVQQTAPVQKKEISQLGQMVVARKNKIQSMQNEFGVALGSKNHVTAEKFVRTVLTAIQMNPQIAEASEQSVINACMKAATDGLILDGREAALTIYNVNKGTKEQPKWAKEAQYMPMVTGIIKRVRNTGEVSRFNAFVVHKNDKFTIRLGLEMSLEHEPNFENPGEVIGAYAICRFTDGLDDFEFMPKNQIDAIRARSKSPDKGPWRTDYEEMCKKTVMRRLSKRLPMSSDLHNVIQRVDEMYDMYDSDETVDNETGEILESQKPKRQYNKRTGVAAAVMEQAVNNDEQSQAAQSSQQSEQHPGAGEQVIDASYSEVSNDIPEDII